MAMEEEATSHMETVNKVMCLLTDPEGKPLGPPTYFPQNFGPQQLQQTVHKLLSDVSFTLLFYFYFLNLIKSLLIDRPP